MSWFSAELGPKRLTLLHDLVPDANTVAFLLNPNNAETVRQSAELQEAARGLGLQIVIFNAATPGEIDTAFATISQNRIGALVVAGDSYLANRREQIITLAARSCRRCPTRGRFGPPKRTWPDHVVMSQR